MARPAHLSVAVHTVMRAAKLRKLQAIKGRFILSINDRPEIRELFAWASFEEVEVIYGIGPDKGHVAKELVIRGGAG